MKLKFYSFHDALTNGYSQPFLQNNRAQGVERHPLPPVLDTVVYLS